jgi:hypothetical protein
VQRVRELTDGFGVHAVLECVGLEDAIRTAIAPPGGAVGRVGVPQVETIPASLAAYFANVTVGGGLAPVHASVEELLPRRPGRTNRTGPGLRPRGRARRGARRLPTVRRSRSWCSHDGDGDLQSAADPRRAIPRMCAIAGSKHDAANMKWSLISMVKPARSGA